MTEKLDFTLPQREGKENRPAAGRSYTFIGVAVLAILVNMAITLALVIRSARPEAGRNAAALSGEAQKDLALKLEKQGLAARAAEAWKEYLVSSSPRNDESARILYRIGTLYQDAGDYDKALENYYRSESSAKVDELASEIGRRTRECLELLGKFSALRYELEERVGIGTNSKAAGEEVLAELGPQKITKGDLDRKIEEQIERRLVQFSSALSEDERNKQKETMFERMSSSSDRLRMLNQMVIEELLYRKARELKMGDDPGVRALLRDVERGVLAEQVLQKETATQIKISQGDLTTWYEANKQKFLQPERAKISHIAVKDDEAAGAIQKRLKTGEKFEDLAKELSTDKQTAEKGGTVEGMAVKGSASIPGVGYSEDGAAAIFGTKAGEVCEKAIKTDNGVHVVKVREIVSEQQRPFDEVKQEIYRDLYAQKERETQERLFEELKKKHNVVIHTSTFAGAKEKEEDSQKSP